MRKIIVFILVLLLFAMPVTAQDGITISIQVSPMMVKFPTVLSGYYNGTEFIYGEAYVLNINELRPTEYSFKPEKSIVRVTPNFAEIENQLISYEFEIAKPLDQAYYYFDNFTFIAFS